MAEPVVRAAHAAASAAQRIATELGMAQPARPQPNGVQFDDVVTDADLRAASRSLFQSGHYSQAVFEAFKLLNNLVKKKSKINDDGASLMNSAFSSKTPVLRLNALSTKSEQDEQLGYQLILAGSMTGVRNPRGHEHGNFDSKGTTIELLTLANHLVRKVRQSTKSKGTKKGKTP